MAAAAAQIQRDCVRSCADDGDHLVQIFTAGMDRTVQIGLRPGAELLGDKEIVGSILH
jgi:hypothetical protein